MKPTIPSIIDVAVAATLSAYLALTGCAPPAPQPLAAAPTSLSLSACLGNEWSPTILPSSELPSYRLLTGGTVTSDDFVLGMWLFCDPSLVPSDPFEPDYSEIGGLGLHWEWLYRGQTYEGNVTEELVVNGEVVPAGGSGPHLQSGDAGATTGPIETPSGVAAKAAAAGQPIQFTLRINVGASITEASLTISLKPFPDGYRLASATLSVPGR
jgi:hypothetical protein